MNHAEIKQIRIALRLTQRQFAEALGVGYRTLQRYEGGKRIIPQPIEKLAGRLLAELRNNQKNQD